MKWILNIFGVLLQALEFEGVENKSAAGCNDRRDGIMGILWPLAWRGTTTCHNREEQ